MNVVEPIATTCNIASNAIVLRSIYANPNAPIPRLALGLQICGNAAWVAFATVARDYYLLLTALTSVSIQVVSFALHTPTRVVREDSSTDSLPSFSPLVQTAATR